MPSKVSPLIFVHPIKGAKNVAIGRGGSYFGELLLVLFALVSLKIQMKQSTTKLACVKAMLRRVNKHQKGLAPLEIINLSQVTDQVLDPHVLLIVGQDVPRVCKIALSIQVNLRHCQCLHLRLLRASLRETARKRDRTAVQLRVILL